MRLVEQNEPHMRPRNRNGESRLSGRLRKVWKNRSERRRAKNNPEAPAMYGRYSGWEY